MNKSGEEPYAKTRDENDRKREISLEAEERCNIEEDAGQNSPKRPFGKALHDFGITLVFQIHPREHESARKGHDSDETCGRW